MREELKQKFNKMVKIQKLLEAKEWEQAKKTLLELKGKIPEPQKEWYDTILKELDKKIAEKLETPNQKG